MYARGVQCDGGIAVRVRVNPTDLVHLQEQQTRAAPETALGCMFGDDACILSRSE